jgi:glycosyltransferase involved in cell wall biosynthesis
MRIGIDARMYSTKFTGIGRYVKELIDTIAEIDTENEYVIFFNDEEYSRYFPPNPRISKRRVSAGYYSVKEQTSLVSALNREELDLMHFTHFNAPILYKKPSIVTIHDLTLSKFPGQNKTSFVHKLGYQMTIKNIINKAWKIICVSENTKQDAIKMLSANVEKISVIYEGISSEFVPVDAPEAIQSVTSKYNISKPFFLYSGAWRKHKNLPNLVKAYNLFRNMYGTENQLVLAGKVDPNYKEVQETISSLGLSAHIVIPGFIADEDMAAMYSAARSFVFPSLYEGFGLPPLEAMACGTPVAVSNISSLPEICGNSAEYFDPNNPEDICKAMHQTFDNEERRNALIQSGLEHVKTFSWDKMTRSILGLYAQFDKEKKQRVATEAAQKQTASNKPIPDKGPEQK